MRPERIFLSLSDGNIGFVMWSRNEDNVFWGMEAYIIKISDYDIFLKFLCEMINDELYGLLPWDMNIKVINCVKDEYYESKRDVFGRRELIKKIGRFFESAGYSRATDVIWKTFVAHEKAKRSGGKLKIRD